MIQRLDRRALVAGLAAVPLGAAGRKPREVRVRLVTEKGTIVLALYPDQAPITVANFLAYADQGLMKGGTFYRTVSPRNDNNPATISVIQGGLGDAGAHLPPIAHETTKATGLRHVDGTISMARDKPGSATSEFFICLGDNSALDYGGARNKDGQGFAAFGRVVEGMDVVRAIHDAPTISQADDPYMKGQIIEKPVKILELSRK
ncbi:peptidylprolyl isomerase [Caulobacter sp. SSI4214]|uniref:peptidylprolyl isomerase n=1 Tax=Caulobacter sp. SSI4214 TaxID=2575739 RepID=UPI00143A6505|nr:peptidylprolyl isomerase [Caulobacter sp. SSI4214]